MKQITLAFTAFLAVSAQLIAQDVTYVLFNRNCMNQLEYRYAYSRSKDDNSSVWAYSIKPNVQEHYIFMTEGAGHYSPELPSGTITCRNLSLDDAFAADINRKTQQMLIVFQRQSGGYWLMPVRSATLVARNGSRYWVRTQQSSFQFDTLRMINEQNVAVAGSPTAAYFSGAKLNNCLMEYSFHCEPVKGGQLHSDFQFIPSIGITNDRTGNSAAQAMENELQLVRVNGKPIAEFITEQCPDGPGKIAISRYEKPANYGDPRFEADKEISSIMQSEQKGERPVEHNIGLAGSIQCAEDWEPGTHIVQKGENLRAIARTYKVAEQDLVKWNKIQNPNLIEVCQKIWLKQPPANRNASTKGAAATKPVQHDQQQARDRGGKTVKMQGQEVAQGMAPKTPAKSYDPVRPLAYDYSAADEPASLPDGSGARIHTVHRGEYLYKIAKMYNCPEECIRQANGMEIEGDVPLNIGQKLVIPECVCVAYGKTYRPGNTASATAPKGGTAPKPAPTVTKQTARRNLLDEPERPKAYDYEEQAAKPEKDNTYEESPLYGTDEAARTAGNRSGTGKSADNKKEKVQLFREHHVKQGETLGSIASKFRVDASELSQVNGLDPKEPLVPGKVVLIPVDGE
jgi:LysM repeat protein